MVGVPRSLGVGLTTPLALTSLAMGRGVVSAGVVPPSYPQFAPSSKFRIIGDSIFGRGHSGASPGNGIVIGKNNGSFEYAFGSKPRFNFEAYPTDNSVEQAAYTTTWVDGGPGAVPGSGVDFHETLVARTITMDPDVFAYSATINSRAVPNAEDRIIAIYEQMIAAGIYVMAGIMPPAVQGASLADANYVANRPRINAAIRNWVASKPISQAMLIDWDVVMDPGGTGYCTRPELLLDDKVHVHPYGASVLSDYINSRLDLIALPGPDLFDQRWSGLANLYPNGTFTGTSASRAGSWASGSVLPGQHRGVSAGSSTTLSGIVSTLEPNPQTGGQTLVMPITPKSTSLDSETFILTNTSVDNNGTINNAAFDGKWLVAAAEVEVDAGAFQGTPTLYGIANANASPTYSRSLDIDSGNGNTAIRRGKTETFKMMTDPFKIDAGVTQARVQLIMRSLGLSAWNAQGATPYTVRPKRMALWDVGSPRARLNQ